MKKQKIYSITVQILQEKSLKATIKNAKDELKNLVQDISTIPEEILFELREVTNHIFTKYKPEIIEIMGDNSVRCKSKNFRNMTRVKISEDVKRLQMHELEFYQMLGMFEYSSEELLDSYYDSL